MIRSSVRALLLVGLFMANLAPDAFGCKCATPSLAPGQKITPLDMARLSAEGTDVIFEGKVERIVTRFALLEAAAGELIPAAPEEPYRLITFKVSRVYRGTESQSIIVSTGLGFGDCGYEFELNRAYLVYADEHDGQLTTGICSGTTSLEDAGPDLRFLRGEPATAEELSSTNTANPTSHPAADTKICGRLSKADGGSLDDLNLSALRVDDTLGIAGQVAELKPDGLFCARLKPGKYFLMATEGEELNTGGLVAFYPGTPHKSDATPIEVRTGKTVSGLVFKIPAQELYSVRGRVITSNNSALPKQDMEVVLMDVDDPLLGLYHASVAADGSFEIPRVRPGRYHAASVLESDDDDSQPSRPSWLTRKLEITISTDVSDLVLTLFPGR